MWIRSQDKSELINSERMVVNGNDVCILSVTEINDASYIKVGTYATQKRAVEVLDELQEMIENAVSWNIHIPYCDLDNQGYNERITQAVFQMPEI